MKTLSVLLGIFLLFSCREQANSKTAYMKSTTDQQDPKPWCAALQERAFQDMIGIPEGWGPEDFMECFPAIGTPVRGGIGSERVQVMFNASRIQGFRRSVKFHFIGEELVRIDCSYPEPFDQKAMLDSLGEPTAKQDYDIDGIVVTSSAWVYASRGICLFFNQEHSLVVKVILFRPCSVEEFGRKVFFSRPERER